MSAFREHFLDKYFGYRRKYVDHFVTRVPERAQLARQSEIVRLSFTTIGSVLVAAIFWLLVVAAISRAGTVLAALPMTFIACALVPTAFACLAIAGIAAAARDRERIETALQR